MYSSDLGSLSMSRGTAIACSLALMLFCASGPMKNARSLFLESTIALRIHFPVPNINKVWSLWYNVLNASKGHLMDKNKLITPNSVIVTSHAKTYTNGFPLNGWSRWLPDGYPLKTFNKALKALRKPLGFFLFLWRRWEKPFKNLFQSVGSVRKSRWVFFPYPLKALRKAVGKNVF